MKIQAVSLSLVMGVLAVGLAGCAAGSTTGSSDVLTPLDRGAWPTAQAAAATPTPTRFPQITLAPDLATRKRVATVTTTPSLQNQAPGNSPASGNPTGTPEVTPGSGMTAEVRAEALNLRQGPGANYAAVSALHRGDKITVLACNAARDWLLVQTGAARGWVSVPYVTLQGKLDEVPQASSELVPTPPSTAAATAGAAGDRSANGKPAGSAAPVSAAATSGRLVFQLASGGDIMIADGANAPRRLTSGMDPALSPDRQTVAFTRWQGDIGSVWLINVDGTQERMIQDGLHKAKGAEWSPDGKSLVLNYQHEGRLQPVEVCVSLLQNKNPSVPWNAYDAKVKFKNRLPYLCYMKPADPHWGLWVIDLASGHGKDVYGGMYAFHPTWDPVRTWRIVCSAGNGLLETSVNGDHYQNITDQVEDRDAAFSPNGQYLAVAFNQNGRRDIQRLNTDGTGRVRLTDMPLWAQVGPDKVTSWNNVAPAWSPDGSQIAFLTDRTGRWEIWVMGADGSAQHPMFSESVNASLKFTYDYGDERVLSWR